MTLRCGEVSDEPAGCGTPSASYFTRENQELAPGGRHQFWIGCGLDVLNVPDRYSELVGGARSGDAVRLDGGDERGVADEGHPLV